MLDRPGSLLVGTRCVDHRQSEISGRGARAWRCGTRVGVGSPPTQGRGRAREAPDAPPSFDVMPSTRAADDMSVPARGERPALNACGPRRTPVLALPSPASDGCGGATESPRRDPADPPGARPRRRRLVEQPTGLALGREHDRPAGRHVVDDLRRHELRNVGCAESDTSSASLAASRGGCLRHRHLAVEVDVRELLQSAAPGRPHPERPLADEGEAKPSPRSRPCRAPRQRLRDTVCAGERNEELPSGRTELRRAGVAIVADRKNISSVPFGINSVAEEGRGWRRRGRRTTA